MNCFSRGFSWLALATMIGCNQGTPGGPGTSAKPSSFGQSDNTFNLSLPVLPSSLQQGEESKVVVSIKRAKNFEEDVTLQMTGLPNGVTIEPSKPTIKHGDKETVVIFKASGQAAIGESKVKITGHPTKGSDAHVELSLGIVAKKDFTISSPILPTSLKQGGMKVISIGIERERGFDQDVPLLFANIPLGVTLEPSSPVIVNGTKDIDVMFNTSSEAALGSFDVNVTGSSATGAKSTSKFNLTVSKD